MSEDAGPIVGRAHPDMDAAAADAAEFLKALSHEGRLRILCHLAVAERSVGELEALLGNRQSAVSQQLARLRLEGMVSWRREGKSIVYSLADPRVEQVLILMTEIFCESDSLAEPR